MHVSNRISFPEIHILFLGAREAPGCHGSPQDVGLLLPSACPDPPSPQRLRWSSHQQLGLSLGSPQLGAQEIPAVTAALREETEPCSRGGQQPPVTAFGLL